MRSSNLKSIRCFAQVILACGVLFFACVGNLHAETFVDNKDGTVTDTMSGLMWSQKATPYEYMKWDQALAAVSSCSLGGKGGWRLPTKDELVELYSHMGSGSHPFDMRYPDTIPHWSSTVSQYDPWKEYYRNYTVYMKTGEVKTYAREGTYSYIWPVRNAN
ncbi:MAG: DUF1566 domain-containing protein [Pseudodesulfovibrio sp.]|uniref:Lcl C-terminal domain-containing protein n=1 Tax=Pseudodesulfovibrio aespoeensis (strain ATCC 700646 / DSM 10631 / Aspo-2) TaxID=643562 RepID=E6VTH0_PSEA9|nr:MULTISPECIES: DUF1566 domain-containing protein [Pseudodesulfovibrio]MBU4521293.1 DUF1566 domain-containing protein [Pseudomonadota bacterium]ADU62147.1 hypothetical protein Daes_1131 [Pseudodesulfovibrio aespoeensis Aspo-2]MBU4560275.1 DUF1566 domain-containing protein [Pseudomonadota bacterium]MBV1764671.1 DUF1566 domain-containing protein [Pseudodesulfovibrio sp.]MBV1771406.1 DUF1566 domain-containing protein [Pseudodesulfovibrio sp.]